MEMQGHTEKILKRRRRKRRKGKKEMLSTRREKGEDGRDQIYFGILAKKQKRGREDFFLGVIRCAWRNVLMHPDSLDKNVRDFSCF